jgi:coenzyme F420 hydrogenase subunit beta
MRIDRVIDGGLCAGCGLCASILGKPRAHMTLDQNGYLRPEIDGELSNAENDLLSRVCPGGRLAYEAEGRPFETIWGPVLDAFTGCATDPRLRFQASSGGALSALASHMLESGAADYVIHVGADPDTPWLNQAAESTTAPEILERAGSRYAPSAPLAAILQRLQRPGRAVVIGKPCDIAALRMYSRENPHIADRIAGMFAFLCGGVPSRRGVELILARMRVDPRDVISFRFRGYGWPGRASATLKSGEQKSLTYAETWGGILTHHVQKRCKICPDGTGIFGDVSCGDAWHLDDRGRPVFDESEGRSLMIARTAHGASVLASAAQAGRIATERTSLASMTAMQPGQIRRTQLTLSRLAAMALLGRPVPSFSGLHLARAARRAGLLANIKSFLGAVRRVLRGQL